MSDASSHAALVDLIRQHVNTSDEFKTYLKGLLPKKEVKLSSFPIVKRTSTADIEFSHYEGKIYIIGEAKTTKYSIQDSLVQLDNYIQFLKHKTNPWLIYSVPYIQEGMTNGTIIRRLEKLDAHKINFKVISDMH